MIENREPGSRMEQKLLVYYAISPRQEFLPSLKRDLLRRVSAGETAGKASPALPARFRRPAFVLVALALVLCAIGFATPPGRTLARQMLQFFTRAGGDTLPLQSWQLTPLPTPGTPTPDPASILDAGQTVSEVEAQAGFDVLEPAWLPASLVFAGASLEPEPRIVRLFYRHRQAETNGLVLREEAFARTETCELCGEVGASAAVETVRVGDVMGEYVVGVWKLTDAGPVWEPDPYLQSLRWQSDGTALELQYMGPAEDVTREDLIAVAESLR